MKAVFKHELKQYFDSMTAYVFGAFLLLFIGIGSMLYNLQSAVSNFEFVLSFAAIVFVVIVPVLTMRTLSEERKQKTDQLELQLQQQPEHSQHTQTNMYHQSALRIRCHRLQHQQLSGYNVS